MKLLVVLLALAVFATAENILPGNTAFGYIANVAIPRAEEIRKAEEKYLSNARIVGGVPAALGQYPFQAGLLSSYIGLDGTGVCGGSLVTPNRVITAAHCWYDGQNQAWRVTVVLGTVTLFTGGTRVDTSVVAMHPNWTPSLIRNDVAVIYLPSSVTYSNTIAPISLPSGSEINEDFAGSSAIASGFGLTSDSASITTSQILSHVNLNVITNSACSFGFPLILQSSNVCTSGIGGVGTCRGDSGGPLVVNRNGRQILIGITSFGSGLGCESILPAVFARVTSFLDFINPHLL